MYKIETLERKTVGVDKKPIIRATIKDNQGVVTDNVTLWSGFPNFADLKVGDVVEGDLKIVPNGQYVNNTLNPISPAAKPAGGAFKGNSGAITKAMDRKEAGIEKFQDNKSESVKIASTMRDAVLLAIAEFNQYNGHRTLDELVVKWRHWLFLQWDKTSPDEIAPF